MSPSVTWVLESDVFPVSHPGLRVAIRQRGQKIVDWQDDWATNAGQPALDGSAAVFHGSLGNASTVEQAGWWCTGAYCAVPQFCCSAWYESARPWLLHRKWHVLPLDEFVRRADEIIDSMETSGRAFVRPDSPLKPFSGRVVSRGNVDFAALDYGYYYDDRTLPITVAPVSEIGREWRFVVVRRLVVAGSSYDPSTRRAVIEPSLSAAQEFAAQVAANLPPPEDVYVLDICESRGELWLLELNPFSGADLYASSACDIVEAISTIASDTWASRHSAD